jgi:DNA-binding winged helix-turn-helix (wHTH) protein/TolB-like protein/Flp pilus assembly protein TadD
MDCGAKVLKGLSNPFQIVIKLLFKSSMINQIQQLYEFGVFLLNPAERLLLRDGEVVSLSPKAFDTLLILVKNSRHIVTKDVLMEELWGQTIVEEATLAQNISTLRKALGEGVNGNQYIETVPKYGYRFVADVKETCNHNTTLPVEGQKRSARVSEAVGARKEARPIKHTLAHTNGARREGFSKTTVLLVAGLTLLCAIALALAYRRTGGKEPPVTGSKTIAVLPFKPLSDLSRDETLEFGMAETLITKLSNIERLVVKSMGSVRKYAGLEQDPLAAGRELKVDFVLEGSVQKSEDRVRITARLLSTKDGQSIWADTFDENSLDVFRVQAVISEYMTQALDIKLSGDEKRRLVKRDTESAEAYEAYLKGRLFWNKRTEEALKRGIEYFEQAIAKDSHYAQAFAGLADSYNALGTWGFLPPKEVFPKARQAAAKALEIDPRLGEARVAMAFATYLFDRNAVESERDFQQAIADHPNYATARQLYGICLVSSGRLDDAVREIKRAQESDPVALNIMASSGWIYVLGRQYDQAEIECRKALDLNANFHVAHKYLALAKMETGAYTEAISGFQKAYDLSGGTPYLLAELGHAYAMAGKRQEAERVLKELQSMAKRRYVPPYPIALIYMGLGKRDEAFAWLEKAYEERHPWLVQIKVDPRLDPLRTDPRFAELERRVFAARP